MLYLLEEYKVVHLMSPYLRVFGGMAFAVFTLFDFLSSHKFHTQIKVWRHLCNTMLGFSASSRLSQCPFIKSPFLYNVLDPHEMDFLEGHTGLVIKLALQFSSSMGCADYTLHVSPFTSVP